MYLQKGLGKGFAVPLFAAAMIVSGAKAALVSFSTVVTNNTTAEKEFTFTKDFTLMENLGNTGGFGSLAIVVTDVRGGGAYLKSSGLTSIYRSFVKNIECSQLTSNSSIVASQFGQSSYSIQYAPKPYGIVGNITDIIKTELKFILSAGDQAVISSTFEVNSVPAPGALALICIAGGFSVRGRRRSN